MFEQATLGRWLRDRRRQLDLTQEELARQIGCSRDLIKKIELGQRRPSRQIAELLAHRLAVPQEQRTEFVRFARSGDSREAIAWRVFAHASPPNNLPAQPTPFVGREKELDKLGALVMREGVRLVTLIGAGGIGKTRLAIRAAEMAQGWFEDGVFLVPLDAIRDPGLVVPSICQVLGVRETGNQPRLAALKDRLRGRRILLLLDNFEHVIEASLSVADLLTGSAGLKVLITSRELLRLHSEYTFPVPPLGVPSTSGTELEPVALLSEYGGVKLFIERARAADASFSVTSDNARAVVEICRQLEGLPLAIELAAAQLSMFPPDELLVRLSQRLSTLTGGPRDIPPRHQTLADAIEWSYSLLGEGEQQLFRRLAVFDGGGSLEAVKEVCDYDGRWGVNLVEGVQSLLRKSLIQEREGAAGQPRFWMLQTINEYARQKLGQSGEARAVQRQHALFFMQLAEDAALQLTGEQQTGWLRRLEEEHANMRAAVGWARVAAGETGDRENIADEAVEVALRTVTALAPFWSVYGYYSEGRAQLASALSACARLPVTDEETGNTAVAYPALYALVAKALSSSGDLARLQGEHSAARSLLEQSVAIQRQLGNRSSLARSLNHLAVVAKEQGEFEKARALLEEGLVIQRQLGSTRDIVQSLNSLGIVAQRMGDYASARSLHEQSLSLSRDSSDIGGMGQALNNLGNVACLDGHYAQAHSSYLHALRLAHQIGNKYFIAWSLVGLAAANLSPPGPALLAAKRAARLIGASEAILESIGGVLDVEDRVVYDHATSAAHARLEEQAFDHERQRGRAMSTERAVAYALEERPTRGESVD